MINVGFLSDGSTTDEIDNYRCVAKIENRIHSVKLNRQTGELFNPSESSDVELSMKIKGIGIEKYCFTSVSKECFDYYTAFLKSRNRVEYNQAVRLTRN